MYSVVIFLLDKLGYISDTGSTRLKDIPYAEDMNSFRTYQLQCQILPQKDGAKMIFSAFIYHIYEALPWFSVSSLSMETF